MISIIIPTLNEEDSIGATLEYLKGCVANTQAEIILTDGGSKDKTRDIASEYGIKALTGTDSSRAFLMNLGAKEAKGDILFFLHADSCPPKTFIKDIEQALKDESVVGGAFDHKFSEDVFSVKVVCFFNRIRFHLTKSYYGDQGIFVRKVAFKRLDGYRNMRILEDLDFSERLKRVGKTALIRKRMLTSGRRFIKGGVIKTSMFMLWIRILHRLGFDAERLAEAYRAFSTSKGN
ncbi:MAG: TIGR04283 family arsenosugar biosynthesis glycosyltransferase [Candidatus Brocadiales bacterium]